MLVLDLSIGNSFPSCCSKYFNNSIVVVRFILFLMLETVAQSCVLKNKRLASYLDMFPDVRFFLLSNFKCQTLLDQRIKPGSS